MAKKTEVNVNLPNMPEETADEANQESKNTYSPRDSKCSKRDKMIEHGLLLHYQLPILQIKRPSGLKGPFNFDQVNSLRQLRLNLKSDCKQQINSVGNSLQFYDDLELENFFKDKSNWTSKPKFTNTNSFLNSAQTYLPNVRFDKEILAISEEYKNIHHSKNDIK